MDGVSGYQLPAQSAPAFVRDVLVVGLGNLLLGDDGVGVHVVRCLAADPAAPDFLHALDGGTLGFRLMDTVARSDAVLFVDAVELRLPPGTIRLIDADALALHVRNGGRFSAHEAGLVDLLSLMLLDGWAPRHVAVLGVQPRQIGWNERLSEAVAAALPAACRLAVETVQDWRRPA